MTTKQKKINAFYWLVAKAEGKKKQTPIAQIREVGKLFNKFTGGEFYKMIEKRMPDYINDFEEIIEDPI